MQTKTFASDWGYWSDAQHGTPGKPDSPKPPPQYVPFQFTNPQNGKKVNFQISKPPHFKEVLEHIATATETDPYTLDRTYWFSGPGNRRLQAFSPAEIVATTTPRPSHVTLN